MHTSLESTAKQSPWNKGRLSGQKRPLRLQEIWAIRIRLELSGESQELALFNLAIDSKLRACDLMKLRVSDVTQGGRVQSRARVIQQKTQQPVQFEITPQTRQSLEAWIAGSYLIGSDYLFKGHIRGSPHLSTRQYARIVKRWVCLLHWLRSKPLWNSLDAQDESCPHLQENEEHQGYSVASRTYQARKHRQVSGNRCR